MEQEEERLLSQALDELTLVSGSSSISVFARGFPLKKLLVFSRFPWVPSIPKRAASWISFGRN